MEEKTFLAASVFSSCLLPPRKLCNRHVCERKDDERVRGCGVIPNEQVLRGENADDSGNCKHATMGARSCHTGEAEQALRNFLGR